jgi:peptidylprolyl isomerase
MPPWFGACDVPCKRATRDVTLWQDVRNERDIAMHRPACALALLSLASLACIADEPATTRKAKTMADILAESTAADWRRPDPENVLYLELAHGRVVLELAPGFAPKHVANIKTLVRGKYFDGLAITRAQDNFVVQWGDPDAGEPGARPLGDAKRALPAEFTRDARRIAFRPLPDRDGWAPQSGFAAQMPAARDAADGRAWLVHCYGTLGVGRDVDVDSGGGSELYVVIGHAPRQLDRNITVAGRVLHGMEHLSTLARGTDPLGFYEKPEQRTPIRSIRVAADVPAAERTNIEIMRTDTPLFAELVAARRDRRDEWYKVPAGYIDVCSIPIPVRSAPAETKPSPR